jgi:hypothetical protein
MLICTQHAAFGVADAGLCAGRPSPTMHRRACQRGPHPCNLQLIAVCVGGLLSGDVPGSLQPTRDTASLLVDCVAARKCPHTSFLSELTGGCRELIWCRGGPRGPLGAGVCGGATFGSAPSSDSSLEGGLLPVGFSGGVAGGAPRGRGPSGLTRGFT